MSYLDLGYDNFLEKSLLSIQAVSDEGYLYKEPVGKASPGEISAVFPSGSLGDTFPDDTGASGKFLTTDGAGTRSWASISNVATVITVADGDNDVALTINQNDVTNDPDGVVINNATEGRGLLINQTGNGNAIRIVSTSTTNKGVYLQLNNLTTATGFHVLHQGTSLTGDLVRFEASVGGSSGRVLYIRNAGSNTAVEIQNRTSGTELCLDLDHNGADESAGFRLIEPAGGVFEIYRVDTVQANIVLKLGRDFLWFDATRDLRTNASIPDSDTDGTVIGSQS